MMFCNYTTTFSLIFLTVVNVSVAMEKDSLSDRLIYYAPTRDGVNKAYNQICTTAGSIYKQTVSSKPIQFDANKALEILGYPLTSKKAQEEMQKNFKSYIDYYNLQHELSGAQVASDKDRIVHSKYNSLSVLVAERKELVEQIVDTLKDRFDGWKIAKHLGLYHCHPAVMTESTEKKILSFLDDRKDAVSRANLNRISILFLTTIKWGVLFDKLSDNSCVESITCDDLDFDKLSDNACAKSECDDPNNMGNAAFYTGVSVGELTVQFDDNKALEIFGYPLTSEKAKKEFEDSVKSCLLYQGLHEILSDAQADDDKCRIIRDKYDTVIRDKYNVLREFMEKRKKLVERIVCVLDKRLDGLEIAKYLLSCGICNHPEVMAESTKNIVSSFVTKQEKVEKDGELQFAEQLDQLLDIVEKIQHSKKDEEKKYVDEK